MKHRLLTSALSVVTAMAIAPQAQPRQQNRAHIEPVMTLRPIAADNSEYELLIYGDIGDSWWGESVTAQSVAQQLNTLDASVVAINVRINSYGGSVADGLAIYNALKRHKASKNVTVDGVAMSSASLIAMAGDTVTMPPTSLLMIHAPWGGLYGNAKELRQYADTLDKFSESMADAYAKKSGIDRATVLSLLTDGEDHYYTGEEAIAAGFADAVGEDAKEEQEDASARAFTDDMYARIAARAPARYAGLAITAALRGMHNPASVPSSRGRESPAAVTPPAPTNPPAPAAITPPAAAGHTTGDVPMTDEEKKAAAKAALAADKERRAAIRNQFAPFLARTDLDKAAVAALLQECEDDHDVDVAKAAMRLTELLGKQTEPTPSGGGRAEGGEAANGQAYREGVQAALLHRFNPSAHKLPESAHEFRGMTLLDMARDSVERAGQRTRGMSRQEIAVKALQSTSDFPAIMEGTVTRTLRAGYAAAPRTFTPWARQATLPDFKEVARVAIAGTPDLKRVLEGAEYEYGAIGAGAEKYAVQKYGRIVAITWETLVNDDLNAFTNIPLAFGASAAALESDIVYGILTSNPLMADGHPLFSAEHGNLGTAAALIDAVNPDPSVDDPIAEIFERMVLQKGPEGRYISLQPRYLLVPPKLQAAAMKVTNAAIVAAQANNANLIGPSLTPIVEPRLQANSVTRFYGAAEPTLVDTIEYAYLEGNEGVFTETRQGFHVDGVEIKCRHVFGAKAIDWRGLYRNDGGAPSPYPTAG